MSGVAWVRLDTGFSNNPKILELVDSGNRDVIAVYICGLTYAGSQGNEGWIPAVALRQIHGTKQDAETLVTAGLWEARPGGWSIHDWCDYQASNETIKTRTDRARNAAYARWHGNNGAS